MHIPSHMSRLAALLLASTTLGATITATELQAAPRRGTYIQPSVEVHLDALDALRSSPAQRSARTPFGAPTPPNKPQPAIAAPTPVPLAPAPVETARPVEPEPPIAVTPEPQQEERSTFGFLTDWMSDEEDQVPPPAAQFEQQQPLSPQELAAVPPAQAMAAPQQQMEQPTQPAGSNAATYDGLELAEGLIKDAPYGSGPTPSPAPLPRAEPEPLRSQPAPMPEASAPLVPMATDLSAPPGELLAHASDAPLTAQNQNDPFGAPPEPLPLQQPAIQPQLESPAPLAAANSPAVPSLKIAPVSTKPKPPAGEAKKPIGKPIAKAETKKKVEKQAEKKVAPKPQKKAEKPETPVEKTADKPAPLAEDKSTPSPFPTVEAPETLPPASDKKPAETALLSEPTPTLEPEKSEPAKSETVKTEAAQKPKVEETMGTPPSAPLAPEMQMPEIKSEAPATLLEPQPEPSLSLLSPSEEIKTEAPPPPMAAAPVVDIPPPPPPPPAPEADTPPPPPPPPPPAAAAPVKEESWFGGITKTVKGYFGSDEPAATPATPQPAAPADAPALPTPPVAIDHTSDTPPPPPPPPGLPPLTALTGDPALEQQAREMKVEEAAPLPPLPGTQAALPPAPPPSPLESPKGSEVVLSKDPASADDFVGKLEEQQIASLPPAETPAAPTTSADAEAQKQISLMFDPSVSTLPASAEQQLKPLVAELKANESLRIFIVAYASAKNDEEVVARRTSLARGLAIRAYLIDQGISQLRINVQSEGSKNAGSSPDRADVIVKNTSGT